MAIADVFVRDDIITEPTYGRFSVCHDHTCQTVVTLSLSLSQWHQITSPLQPPSIAASDERAAIASAVSTMETVVGRLTGTDADKGGNIKGFGQSGQMDWVVYGNSRTGFFVTLNRERSP